MALLIRGGTVVNADRSFRADVLCDAGVIKAVGEGLDAPVGAEVVDAGGALVMPGGIDPHTHMEMPFMGTVSHDDFLSGTAAGLAGGTTMIIDFCLPAPQQSLTDALDQWEENGKKACADYGFHLAVTWWSERVEQQMAECVDRGVNSFKHFMAYKGALMVDDETLFKSFSRCRELGALPMVHAENGDAVFLLQQQLLNQGITVPEGHPLSRPPHVEGEAANRAIMIAQTVGVPLYVVHVSCKEAIDPIAQARTNDWHAWGETCTQYLFIDETALDQPDFEGAKYVYTPPPRPKENQEHLWHALATDVLSVVSTDHCPFNWDGQKTLGRDDFSKIPNGGPGIENRLHMLHHFGVRQGRISMSRFVELVSTNPAKFFGMYPRKGTIAVGSDADIVVFDPEKRVTISAETHHSNIDYNLFEGTEVSGAPEVVLVRGQVIVEGDRLVGKPGAGKFVKRARFGEELPGGPGRTG